MSDQPEQTSPISFPCDFTIKVVGKADDAFEHTVLTLVRKHFPTFGNENYRKRLSKDANYLALSITVHADSKAQLDELYQALSNTPEVMMAL